MRRGPSEKGAVFCGDGVLLLDYLVLIMLGTELKLIPDHQLICNSVSKSFCFNANPIWIRIKVRTNSGYWKYFLIKATFFYDCLSHKKMCFFPPESVSLLQTSPKPGLWLSLLWFLKATHNNSRIKSEKREIIVCCVIQHLLVGINSIYPILLTIVQKEKHIYAYYLMK